MTRERRETAKQGSDTLITYSPHTGATGHPAAHGSEQAVAQARVLGPGARIRPAAVPGFPENCRREVLAAQTWGSLGNPVLTSPHGLGRLE